MKVLKLCILLFLAGLDLTHRVSAQSSREPDSTGPFYLPNIDTWIIHSSAIGEDYKIYVLRTAAYDTGNISLPVLYMTDGDWNMTVAMNCFSMLRQDYPTREPLIVGIGYGNGKNNRFRDLDPKTGGPAFLNFIEKEVIPFIDHKYRTTKEKAIYGYSMGGMFTTYILFNHPGLFDMVFIGAPGNNGQLLMPAAREYYAKNKVLKAKVFVGVGSFEKDVVKNIDSFKNYLLAQKNPELIIRTDITPNANHGAALAAVMQNAIAFGYCEKHQAAKVSPAVFNQFVGTYGDDGKVQPDIVVFTQNNKLYWKWKTPASLSMELVPQTKNEYFMVENERGTVKFRKESNKLKLVWVEDKREFPFTRR